MRLKVAILIGTVLTTSAPAMAQTYVLKCTTSGGEQAADLKIDLKEMTMTWGINAPNYIVDKITDRYITGHTEREGDEQRCWEGGVRVRPRDGRIQQD